MKKLSNVRIDVRGFTIGIIIVASSEDKIRVPTFNQAGDGLLVRSKSSSGVSAAIITNNADGEFGRGKGSGHSTEDQRCEQADQVLGPAYGTVRPMSRADGRMAQRLIGEKVVPKRANRTPPSAKQYSEPPPRELLPPT